MAESTPAKRFGRAAAFPLLRVLEPRFEDVVRRLSDTRQAVHDEGESIREWIAGFEPTLARYAALSGESVTYVGTQLRELTEEVRALSEHLTDGAAPPLSHRAAVVEEPFALRALSGIEPPARVLDVDGARHTLGLALATLGFEVEAVGRPAQGREHPNLNALDVDFPQLGPDDPFAAICCLSGLPSAGDDAGDPWEADAASLAHLRTLLSDGGVMVLALPMGAAVERGRALYDKPRLDALLDGWQLDERHYMREALPGTWMRTAAPEDSAVALVRASVG